MARPINVPVSPNTVSSAEMAVWARVVAERINYLLSENEALKARVTALEAK